MEEIRIICTPFLLAAIVFTLAMLYYDLQFKKKNPWWSQNDDKMHLTQAEKVYRHEERRKHNNALMSWVAVLFMILGLMLLILIAHTQGGFPKVGNYWFYLVPFVGGVLLAYSGIKHWK